MSANLLTFFDNMKYFSDYFRRKLNTEVSEKKVYRSTGSMDYCYNNQTFRHKILEYGFFD